MNPRKTITKCYRYNQSESLIIKYRTDSTFSKAVFSTDGNLQSISLEKLTWKLLSVDCTKLTKQEALELVSTDLKLYDYLTTSSSTFIQRQTGSGEIFYRGIYQNRWCIDGIPCDEIYVDGECIFNQDIGELLATSFNPEEEIHPYLVRKPFSSRLDG